MAAWCPFAGWTRAPPSRGIVIDVYRIYGEVRVNIGPNEEASAEAGGSGVEE